MQKPSPKVMLVVAFFLSLVTAKLGYNYLQEGAHSKTSPTELVVVAVKDIPGRTVITPDMVKAVNVPPELVQSGSIRDVSKSIGITTRIPINAGEQITERRLAGDGKVNGFVGAIPSDKRAFTVAANEITGVAGFVKPGDYVDIFVTFDKSVAGESLSNLLMQNVLVLATNRNDNMEQEPGKEKKELEKTISVTLASSPDEAAMLALAGEKGKIHLALRPFQATANGVAGVTYTTDNLVGKQHKPVPYNPEPVVVSAAVTVAAPKPTPGIQVIRGTKSEMISAN